MEVSVKQQYRITKRRSGEREEVHSTPEFEAESIEECDRLACKHFSTESQRPEYAWDEMNLVRIDAPAIAEQSTHLMVAREIGADEHSL